MADVKLHFFPMSFWSQVVRLSLEEKGVSYDPVVVNIAGGHGQTTPEYFRLNEAGVVPTLVHGDDVVTNATRIIREVDRRFEGPNLTPGDHGAMGQWIERIEALPIRDLTYANRLLPDTENLVAARISKLEENMAANPDLADAYRAKIEVQKQVQAVIGDADTITRGAAVVETFLDGLDSQLGSNAFVNGDGYSLADVVTTPLLMRLTALRMADRWSDGARPNIARYLGEMRGRPTFARTFPPPPGARPPS